MKKWRSVRFIVLLFAVFFIFTVNAHAVLYNRGTDINGNRLIYDSDLNITWYDYTNGGADWYAQTNWASTLTVNFSGTIYDDWRLPITFNQSCEGYTCTNSEMGHLYYEELGNKAYPQTGYGLANTGDFQKLQLYPYFSGTDYPAPIDVAWSFGTGYGNQYGGFKGNNYYALAVRPGDVTVVPEPISSILFVTGGTLLAGRRFISLMTRGMGSDLSS